MLYFIRVLFSSNVYIYRFLWMYKTRTSSNASKGLWFLFKIMPELSNASDFLPTSICVLHSKFWYFHINSLLEWQVYYFHMFRNPVNQFMQLNPFPAVKTFTWTGAERHAWRSRYWRSRGQVVYRRNRRNGARLLQQTLIGLSQISSFFSSKNLSCRFHSLSLY